MTSDRSVTSAGSRVRQFGLYRTIDSRTEEFLRLSRRRQIRQGCACAAVSTAITVTVIVSILLVFEFNTQHDVQKSRQNWGSFINNSAEENLFNKVNMNIDKITMKMLPIIIKAINKNKLIDKLLDEYTTQRTTYERRHTTEFPYKKNVFSDRNNWIRFPASRLLAIEYKTSPIVYFKTQKNDYFTKIRKIRDYQRIMNYVDKMISDRVTYGSTQPMKRNEDYIADDTQSLATTPLTRVNYKKDTVVMQISNTATERINSYGQKINNCKCPKKIGEILTNLISNIKLLIPHYESTEPTFLTDESGSSPCSKESINRPSLNSSVSNLNVEQNDQRMNQTTESPPNISELKVDNSERYVPPKLSDLKRDQTLKTIVSLLKPNVLGNKMYSFKGHSKYSTTPPMFIERTETNQEKATIPITRQGFARHDPFHLITPATEFGFQQRNNFNKRISSDTDYNTSSNVDEVTSTTNAADNFLNLDVHSLELVKKKLISSCKKLKEIVVKKPYGRIKHKNDDLYKIQDNQLYNIKNSSIMDISKMLYPIATVHYLYHRHNTTERTPATRAVATTTPTTTTTRRPSMFITYSRQTTKSTTETTTKIAQIKTTRSLKASDVTFFVKNKMPIKHQILDQKTKDENSDRSEEINLDDDFEKIMIEENYQENDYKDRRVDDATGTSRNLSDVLEQQSSIKSKPETNNKDDFFFTSMALYNKPRSYLEIQRSNLKPESYDINLNNLFD